MAMRAERGGSSVCRKPLSPRARGGGEARKRGVASGGQTRHSPVLLYASRKEGQGARSKQRACIERGRGPMNGLQSAATSGGARER